MKWYSSLRTKLRKSSFVNINSMNNSNSTTTNTTSNTSSTTGTIGNNEIQLTNIYQPVTEVYHSHLIITGIINNHKRSDHTEIQVQVSEIKLGWPVCGGLFKAMVPLTVGHNDVTFTYQGSSLTTSINYTPLDSFPPVQLTILVAKDSPKTYDGINIQHDLNSAIDKMRMMGLLWQSFVADQMHRGGFGRKTFRLVMNKDQRVDVKIIETEVTCATLQDVDIAQQYQPRSDDSPVDGNKPSLFDHAGKALDDTKQFKDHIVACLVLDTKWDTDRRLVRGHAALGGTYSDFRLGIFGSHCTHAWPSNLHEVSQSFMDDSPLDTKFVADEMHGSGKIWNSTNIGVGAFLHELGHAFGMPHTPYGIMSRGFEDLNRIFLARCPAGNPIPHDDVRGACFHRTNLVRLRLHSGLSPTPLPSQNPSIYQTSTGIHITHSQGIGQWILWKGDDLQHYFEFPTPFPLEITLPYDSFKGREAGMDLEICCLGSTQTFPLDQLRSPPSESGSFLSAGAGDGRPDGATPFQLPFHPTHPLQIRSGLYVDSLAIDGVGKYGGDGGGLTTLPPPSSDPIIRLAVYSGFLVDRIQFTTKSGKTSSWLGNSQGGSLTILEAPPGHHIIGLHGIATSFLYSLGIIYAPS